MSAALEAIQDGQQLGKLLRLTQELQKVKRIKMVVAEHFLVSVADIESRKRPDCIAWPRMVAMWLSRHFTGLGTEELGEAFGRQHSCVLRSLEMVKNRAETEDAAAKQIVLLTERVKEVLGI